MATEYVVKIERMRMDRGIWEIDGMSDPMILHEGSSFREALDSFLERRGEAKDTYLTERACGNFSMLRGGYAVVLDRIDTDENGDYLDYETLEMEAYTVDDYEKGLEQDADDATVASTIEGVAQEGPGKMARAAIESSGRSCARPAGRESDAEHKKR